MKWERSDADSRARTLTIAGIALMVLMGVGLALSGFFASALHSAGADKRAEKHPMAEYRTGPAGPRLQAQPSDELLEHDLFEKHALTSYAWIDMEQGIVRIPVERAMKLTLEELGR